MQHKSDTDPAWCKESGIQIWCLAEN